MPKKIYFWAALFWSGIILFFCLISSNELKKIRVPNFDKVIHFFFHFVLTPLWFLFFKKHLKGTSTLRPLAISFVFSVFFGIGVEILQELYTTTRHADIFDVLANTSGASVAVITIYLLNKYNRLNKI